MSEEEDPIPNGPIEVPGVDMKREVAYEHCKVCGKRLYYRDGLYVCDNCGNQEQEIDYIFIIEYLINEIKRIKAFIGLS